MDKNNTLGIHAVNADRPLDEIIVVQNNLRL